MQSFDYVRIKNCIIDLDGEIKLAFTDQNFNNGVNIIFNTDILKI